MKQVYPTLITPNGNDFLVYVPDMGIYTEGKDFADAIEMARNTEVFDYSTGILTFVDVDFTEYRKRIDTKAGINVSRVLQEALKRELNVSR